MREVLPGVAVMDRARAAREAAPNSVGYRPTALRFDGFSEQHPDGKKLPSFDLTAGAKISARPPFPAVVNS
jgi:hypothetical protein